MLLTLALQSASSTPESVASTVNRFTDFLLAYVVALAAVGALSMAFVEAWKKLLDSRTRFQALRWTQWLQRTPFYLGVGDVGDESRARHRAWECLVLVHGFNNTDSEAATAYFGFRTRQKEIFGPPDPQYFERRFGDAFWPGDADWWSFFDKVDFLIYPAAVHTAVKAGNELAELLWQMPNLERVDFIGHSLGCRVVLETLPLLRTRTLPMIGRVVLMAAAVPSEMLEYGGKFHGLLLELAAEGTAIRVLHSMQDTVLHYAFPPGQSLAGGKEASTRALGRFGPSPLMPGYRATLSEREITGAGHGDYWGQSKTPPSRVSTEDAGVFLSLGDLRRDVAYSRDVGVVATPRQPRELASVRQPGE